MQSCGCLLPAQKDDVYLSSRLSACHSWTSAIAVETAKVCCAVQEKKAALADLKRLPVANSWCEKVPRARRAGSVESALGHWLNRLRILMQSSDDNSRELADIEQSKAIKMYQIRKLRVALERRGIVVSRDLARMREPTPPLPYNIFVVSDPM